MADRLRLQTPERLESEPWDPEKTLAEALQEKAEFLRNHPKLITYQHEIDRLLDKAGSSENRMNVLAMLLEGRLIELHGQLRKLNKILMASGNTSAPDHCLQIHPNLLKAANN